MNYILSINNRTMLNRNSEPHRMTFSECHYWAKRAYKIDPLAEVKAVENDEKQVTKQLD